jgi:hypothetical protein
MAVFMYRKAPLWPAITPFVESLSRRLALPPQATVFPAGDDVFARAGAAFVGAAREVYGVPLRLESPKVLPSWPRGHDEVDGTRSLDAFVATHLAVPAVARWFDGATLRDPESDAEAEQLEAAMGELEIPDAPIVIYALGAALATALAHLAEARWIGGDTVDVEQEAPPGMRFGAASVLFPFEAAKNKLADPRASLWVKRVSAAEAPPPRGMAATIEEAREGWTKLLPDGALPLLEGFEEVGALAALAELEALMDAHPENALLVRLSVPVAGQLPDLDRAAALSRRLLLSYPHVNAKFGLADVLACMPDAASQAEGETLFREVLAEQPMMTRARLKLALLLAEQGRTDEAITELREVASTWGDDAEEARGYLEQLGVVDEPSGDSTERAPGPFVLGTVADLARWLEESIVRDHGALAVYLVAQSSSERNRVLSRIPEGPIDDAAVAAIFRALEAFVAENQSKLTALLGETLFSVGFHASATLDVVRPSFEEDGFGPAFALAEGEIVSPS